MTGPTISHYDWSGGREAMLRFGPTEGAPTVVVAMPLFEEANRTRAFVVTMLRLLTTRGVASALPDLPGQGESERTTNNVSLDDWRAAFAAAARSVGERPHVVSLRAGALLDSAAAAASRWRFAPVEGKTWTSEMIRVVMMALPPRSDLWLHDSPDGPPVALFGNPVARKTLIALGEATSSQEGPLRIVRLDIDRAKANRLVPDKPLWRLAEPDNDATLAASLAEDIAEWIASCER